MDRAFEINKNAFNVIDVETDGRIRVDTRIWTDDGWQPDERG